MNCCIFTQHHPPSHPPPSWHCYILVRSNLHKPVTSWCSRCPERERGLETFHLSRHEALEKQLAKARQHDHWPQTLRSTQFLSLHSSPPWTETFLNVQMPVLFILTHHMLATGTNNPLPLPDRFVTTTMTLFVYPERKTCSYSGIPWQMDSPCGVWGVVQCSLDCLGRSWEYCLQKVCSFLPVSSQTTVSKWCE